jgi:hypothetical protein
VSAPPPPLALEGFVRLEDGLDLVLVRHGGSVRRRLGQCAGMSPEARMLNLEPEAPDIQAMPVAHASITCLSAAVFILVVRGPANWSRALAMTWYGLFGAAVVLAVAALAVAGLSRDVPSKRRLTIVGLSLPALLAVPLLIWAVATLAPLAD